MASSDRLSNLIPVFNEARTVVTVLERLLAIDLPVPREILVINDGSSDGTREVLERFGERGDTLRIIHASRNAGKGAAIRRGLDAAAAPSSRSRTRPPGARSRAALGPRHPHCRRPGHGRVRFPLSPHSGSAEKRNGQIDRRNRGTERGVTARRRTVQFSHVRGHFFTAR
jgi:hypothetical protein